MAVPRKQLLKPPPIQFMTAGCHNIRFVLTLFRLFKGGVRRGDEIVALNGVSCKSYSIKGYSIPENSL